MIDIEREEMGAVTTLRLHGDIDEDGMESFRMVLWQWVQDRRCNVVVNLEDVRYISYMGVGVLVERLRQLRAYNGDLKLASVNLYTDRLFRMIGVTKVFDQYSTEAQAIQQYLSAA